MTTEAKVEKTDDKVAKENEAKVLEYKKAVYEWGVENIALSKRGLPAKPFPVPAQSPESEEKAKKAEGELKDLKEPELEKDQEVTDPVYVDKVNEFIQKKKELQAKLDAAKAETVTPALFWLVQRSQDSYIIDTPVSAAFLDRLKAELDAAEKAAEEDKHKAEPAKPTPAKPEEKKAEAHGKESKGFFDRG